MKCVDEDVLFIYHIIETNKEYNHSNLLIISLINSINLPIIKTISQSHIKMPPYQYIRPTIWPIRTIKKQNKILPINKLSWLLNNLIHIQINKIHHSLSLSFPRHWYISMAIQLSIQFTFCFFITIYPLNGLQKFKIKRWKNP
jgi:hypothetical protein